MGHITGTLLGILQTARVAIDEGYVDEAADVIHASVFADFLEMAQHLLDEGYKDASAVIAGSSLEAHLRHLCEKYNVDARHDDGLPKKADRMNADLAKADSYNKLDQKSVTAWLGLRNDAAHAHYDRYGPDQVALQIAGIRDFIGRTS